jgi:GAF domain-containing protein
MDIGRVTCWLGAVERLVRHAGDMPDMIQDGLLDSVHQALGPRSAACVDRGESPDEQHWVGDLRIPSAELRRLDAGRGVVAGNAYFCVQLADGARLCAFRDISEGEFDKVDEAALRVLADVAAALRPRQALESLVGVAKQLIASRDLDAVFLEIANSAARVMRAEMGGILLENPSGTWIEMKCAVGHHTIETANLRMGKGQGLGGWVYETGRPHAVEDWATDPTITKEFLSIASTEGTRSAVGAPIRMDGRAVGVLMVWRRRSSVFADQDIDLMSALADLAGVALARATAIDAERESATRLSDAHEELRARLFDAERAMRIHHGLTQAAVEGAEITTVLAAIADFTDATIGFVDDDMHVITATEEAAERLADSRRHWRNFIREPLPDSASEVAQAVGNPKIWHIRAPVRTAGITWGTLVLESAHEPPPLDRSTLEHAATVCSLLLSHKEAVDAASGRLDSEFVWDLLEGRVAGENDVIVHSRDLRARVEPPARVFLAEVAEDKQPAPPPSGAEHIDRRLRRLARELGRRMEGVSPHAHMLARRGNWFVGVARFVPDDMSTVRKLGAALTAPAESGGPKVIVGVSGIVQSFEGYTTAFKQAQHALSATAGAGRDVVVFEELGVLQFLLAPAAGSDLDRFADSVIGKLQRYDEDHGSNLVPTLEAFLMNSSNLQKAAADLFIHHKTMRYRMNRIEEISGLDMQDPEARFNALLAIKIRRLDVLDAGPALLGSSAPTLSADSQRDPFH